MSLRYRSSLCAVFVLFLGLSACAGKSDAGSGTTGGAGSSAGGSVSSAGSSAGGSSAGGSSAGGSSAGGSSAGGSSAGGSSAGGASACTPLSPTGTVMELVISEIAVDTGIEIYNPGTAAVPLSGLWFCSNYDYIQVAAANGKTEVPAGGYVHLAWPRDNYGTVDTSGGELLLYTSTDGFPTAENIHDYVCWGDHTGGRKWDSTSGEEIEVARVYNGDCTAAPTAGAITLLPSTDGMGPASYDTAAGPTLTDCP